MKRPGLRRFPCCRSSRPSSATAGVKMKLKDISLTGRIIANFPDKLKPAQKINDELAELGKLAMKPGGQHHQAAQHLRVDPAAEGRDQGIAEQGLRRAGLSGQRRDAERRRKSSARYGKVLGSAVNPVLREGNSDRRAAGAVKQYARNHPHKMGAWSKDSKTRVAHMTGDDFYGSEVATTVAAPTNARIELVGSDGKTTVLKAKTPLKAGEIIDCVGDERARRCAPSSPRRSTPRRRTASCSRCTSRRP